MNSIISQTGHRWSVGWCRLLLAFSLQNLLGGCQSAPAEGEYVTFVRELMAESARLKHDAKDGPERSEQVERAVRVWRGAEDEGEEDE